MSDANIEERKGGSNLNSMLSKKVTNTSDATPAFTLAFPQTASHCLGPTILSAVANVMISGEDGD